MPMYHGEPNRAEPSRPSDSTQRKLELVFQDLFKIWWDTPQADEVLQDACRTIGNKLYGMDSTALDAFERRCRGK